MLRSRLVYNPSLNLCFRWSERHSDSLKIFNFTSKTVEMNNNDSFIDYINVRVSVFIWINETDQSEQRPLNNGQS